MATQSERIQVLNAQRALADLGRLKSEFHAGLAADTHKVLEEGAVTATKDQVDVQVVGITAVAVPRPIVTSGRPSALEYDFRSPFGDTTVSILRIYLSEHGGLFSDAGCTNRICDHTNGYIKSVVIQRCALGALASPIFAPG